MKWLDETLPWICHIFVLTRTRRLAENFLNFEHLIQKRYQIALFITIQGKLGLRRLTRDEDVQVAVQRQALSCRRRGKLWPLADQNDTAAGVSSRVVYLLASMRGPVRALSLSDFVGLSRFGLLSKPIGGPGEPTLSGQPRRRWPSARRRPEALSPKHVASIPSIRVIVPICRDSMMLTTWEDTQLELAP
jgi:hypothetical protein